MYLKGFRFQNGLVLGITIFTIFLTSCGKTSKSNGVEKPKQNIQVKVVEPREFETGKVYKSVPCVTNSELSYSLYLPSAYSTEKKWPWLIFLDPHAQGHKPVEKYWKLAEKFGIVMLGSNDSKNGFQDPNRYKNIIRAIVEDAKMDLHVGEKQLILAGFSGGAGAAGTFANESELFGAICVGKGPGPGLLATNHVYSIVGDEDFNYAEFLGKENTVNSAGFSSFVQRYHGKHEWCPETEMSLAIQWMFLRGMEQGIFEKDKAMISEVDHRYKGIRLAGDLAKWQKLSEQYSFLGGLVDLGNIPQEVERLRSSNEVHAYFSREQKDRELEMKLQNQYAPQISIGSEKDWKKIVAELNAHSDPLYQRVRNMLSLTAFMTLQAPMAQRDLPSAERLVNIYSIIDPGNSETKFLLTKVRCMQNRSGEALEAFKNALELGFDDKDRAAVDPDLNCISNSKTFTNFLQ